MISKSLTPSHEISFLCVTRYFLVTFAILSNALLFRYFYDFEERVTFSLLNLSNALLTRY